MRALLCTNPGPEFALEIGDVPDLVPGPGEVVIDVKAAGLNFPDTLIVRGQYQFKPEPPFSPGAEAAGVVAAVGAGVELAVGMPGGCAWGVWRLRRAMGGSGHHRDAAAARPRF